MWAAGRGLAGELLGGRVRRMGLTLAALALLPVVGIASRRLGHGWPAFVRADLGDILWTGEAYALIVLLRPRVSLPAAAGGAWGVSLLVELSQLYHAPWIDSMRATTLGGLLLGRQFIPAQLGLYALGALAAAAADRAASRRAGAPPGGG